MSQGGFTSTKYEADSGDIHFCRLQPETLAATLGGTANSAPTEDINSPFAAEVNRSAKAYGLKPRYVNVAFEDVVPAGYKPYTTLSIPIMSKDVFDGIKGDDAVSYDGGTGKVTSKVGENIRPGQAVIEDSSDSTPPTP